MFLNWNDYRSNLLATIGKFTKLQPEFMKGFQQMDKGAWPSPPAVMVACRTFGCSG